MWLFDLFLNDLPPYIVLASKGTTVIAHGHCQSYPDAVVWCGRAMRKHPDATQIAIARPTVVEWEGFGTAPALMPVEGWARELHGWAHVDPQLLIRHFDEVHDTPTTLTAEPRPKHSHSQPAANRFEKGPHQEISAPTRTAHTDPIVRELRRLNEIIERLVWCLQPKPRTTTRGEGGSSV